ncbi:uncharacterized protein J4E88_006919 [Alternaria novae-zelandiae]|uniref:uncharacterized protein n=1 Tax=Alternaria novae-zelandiae TaxID=430562 RepID=UPI0020C3F083|nr:uncharacterized protein J4E88_006919 [Alternaria novae-zelandiae]KAI4677112.1 hypothetical protein J4E88_006919 [Alternaria novae-zelandiae]
MTIEELFDQLYGKDSPVYANWNDHVKRSMGKAHTLTLLDAAAITPQSYWSEDIRATVEAFTALLEAFHNVKGIVWTDYPYDDALDGRLGRCNDYAFIQRLIFNECRLYGKSLDEYEASMRQIREKFGIPVEFDLNEELQRIKMAYDQQHYEIEERLSEASEMERVGPMIPVTDVSTEIDNPEELFPEPEYRPKDEERFRNYEQQLDDFEDQMYWLSWIQKSADWFGGDQLPPITSAYHDGYIYIDVLRDLRKFGYRHKNPKDVLAMTSAELRKLEQQHFPSPADISRLTGMSDEETEQQADAARRWLLGMLDCHDRTMTREHEIRMFRFAVEKQMEEREKDWTDLERLYMTLANSNLASPQERLQAAFVTVLHFDYPQRRRDVDEVAQKLDERLKRASDMDAVLDETRDIIVARTELTNVDHFACAIPLSLLTVTADNASVVDDNAGCCPICQLSYTSFQDSSILQLLGDYPVRIKQCGHIIGKSCLEQWMRTPKIDEAKYPHRTCPCCRVKIEGVKSPSVPRGLHDHLKTDRRAMETVRELLYGYDMDLEECLSAISACVSEEIACEELAAELGRNDGEQDDQILKDKLANLEKEKRAWGFRGNGIWKRLRDEWMNSGVTRKA